MSWIFFTLWNVLGNGTATFILKQQTKNEKLGYVGVMLIALCYCSLALFPIFLFNFLTHPMLFSNPNGIPFYLGSILFNIAGFYCFIKALSLNELSFFGPLETIRPFFVVLLSLFLFHEQPTLFIIMGIACIVVGATVLQLQKSFGLFVEKLFTSPAPLWVIGSAVFFAITSVLDKHALLYSNPFIYAFLVSMGITLGFVLLQKLSPKNIKHTHFFSPILLGTGILLMIGQIGIYIALKLASPNVVVPLQMTRSLYLSFLGFVILREKGYKRKIVAAILMLIGVFFITR